MSNFTEKIVARQKNNFDNPGVSVAFLGDSVTQGCFEVYRKSETEIETVFDKNHAYHKYFADIFTVLCPNVPVNIINAGISGDSAPHALTRVDEDVLKHNPDLVVVCFGLNDCGQGMEGIDKYINALSEIFDKIKAHGCELIFMTPNMMCTEADYQFRNDDILSRIAREVSERQNAGVLDAYLESAKALCKEKNVTVCDCYAKWKRLHELGFDITSLLSNKINHPTREMNMLFAYSLVETILGIQKGE